MKYSGGFIFLIIISCNSAIKNHPHSIGVKHIIKYFSNGKVKTNGYYIHDSIPIGKLEEFYQNGKDSITSFYDSYGGGNLLNGTTLYYEDGKKFQENLIINGLFSGTTIQLTRSGKKIYKSCFHLGKQVGGICKFDTLNGKIKVFSFCDFTGNFLNFLNYAPSGMEEKGGINKVFFIDTLIVKKINNTSYFNILLLISNPPKYTTSVQLNYYHKNGSIENQGGITNKDIYYSAQMAAAEFSKIEIISKQIDLGNNKTKFQKETIKF